MRLLARTALVMVAALAAVVGWDLTAPETPKPTDAGRCQVSALLVPSCAPWWGVHVPAASAHDSDYAGPVASLERQVGRNFDIVYNYFDMSGQPGELFPDASEQQLWRSGHLIAASWQTRVFATQRQLRWADVASGRYDARVINPEAARLKAWHHPVFLMFDPEMDILGVAAGTPADYVAAYRHVHDRFAALGVSNVIWVWDVTGYPGYLDRLPAFYPGDRYVDWVGYDPYNFAGCHHTRWQSFSQVVDPTYHWLLAHGFGDKPFILAEYGTVANPARAAETAQWYREVPEALAARPHIRALMEWDQAAKGCDTRITQPHLLEPFAAAGLALLNERSAN
jgi:hypothetical protein